MSMSNPLKILFLASEADPFVKVGGLGDVGGSLPNALLDLNADLDVRLVIPFHTAIRTDNFEIHREAVFTIPRAGVEVPVQVFHTELRGLPVYLISGGPFSQAANVYDTDAAVDGEKFIFFSMAALELVQRLDWRPDIVHANDWHTATALYGVRRKQDEPFWGGVKTLLTVHNLCYMGAGSEGALTAYGLPPVDDPDLPWWGQHTPMPLGLWSADEIVAVSPSYAEEIQTPEYGCGMETFLQSRHERITGIVNGIDTIGWDPQKDEALVEKFSTRNLENRSATKLFLQTQFGLEPDVSIPLLAMVTRMDQQKGVDIALSALRLIQKLNWQAILLGSGNPEIESVARKLESDFPHRVCAVIRYDGKLSRQIYGGADILMMPSRYEPCGLAQMIAMRYGAVPLARATGGLRDTIAEGYSGFLFTDASPGVMAGALRRALKAYHKPKVWQSIQMAGMNSDFSWRISANLYADLYKSLFSRKS
jgi:starch synthase